MKIKVFMRISYFIQVKELNKRWTIFSTRNIYNDLMKIQQGLIDNNYPKQRKPIGTK
jgi:hypothetical protein